MQLSNELVMKTSILSITLLASLGAFTALTTTASQSNAEQVRAGLATHQSGFRSTFCLPNQPCRSIEMNIQTPQSEATKQEELNTKATQKVEDPFADIHAELNLDFGQF